MDLIVTQLTDLHIKEKDDLDVLLGRTNSIVGAIFETIRKPEITMLIICVTGDIAYSGTAQQYVLAKLFFDDILEKVKIRDEKMYVRYVFIPGNHDCNFDSEMNTVRSVVLSAETINISDTGTIEICTSIQSEFFKFVEYYVNKDLAMPINMKNIFTENILLNSELSKYRIKLHCFNTAWGSNVSETKNMKFYVPDNIDAKEENDIVITLMHHGDNWFNWEGGDAWDKYHRENSDIILIGHDHKFQFVNNINYDSTTNYYIKGNQLYSTSDLCQSGFNIFKVNLDEDIEFFYTYVWNEIVYEKLIGTTAQPFVRNKFENSKVSIVKEWQDYLEEIEIDIVSKYKTPLLLSDIYTFPVLQGERLDKPEKMKWYRSEEELLAVIHAKRKIVIDGGKEYGKTALLKRLFLIFYETNHFPILISGNKIKSADEIEVNKLIRTKYMNIYNNINIDEIMQLNKEMRVCLIDDFDATFISDKSQKAFIELINNQFDIVIISYNGKNSMTSVIKNLETNEYVSEVFFSLEIGTLRSYGKSKLIEKWLMLENPTQDARSQEFDAKKKAKEAQMQSVIKNGYFSNTPIEFLLILSYIDNTEIINTDYSRYSYIYDSLIRDRINEIAEKDTIMCSAYRTLLELLAYDLYTNNEGTIFNDKYLTAAINNYNENYTAFKISTVKIIQKLVQGKIIEEREDKYKFKYNYMYYYFAGSYIDDILSPDDKDKKIEEILSNLSVEINYNIALFMAYSMSTEFVILPKVKKICEMFLEQFRDFKYEDQRELLDKTNDNILEKINDIYKIPDNKQIPDIQEELKIKSDEVEAIENEEEIQAQKERARENLDTIFNDFTKLLRIIQYQGDILKNYATKIKNVPRHDLISLMGISNLKLIGFLFDMISKETDKIIEVVQKKAIANTEDKEINKEEFIRLLYDYVGLLWTQFIETNVGNLAICWECDMIQDDIIAYREEMQSEFFDMVYIEYRFRITDSKLPVAELERCLKGKRKLGAFSLAIMKHIVAGYLSTYQYDATDKERVCALLGYNYQKLFIEDKKNKVLGLSE